ncbi:FUSC family protein [Photobacterium nomapromontoriensis]|uniref:FUSC family protein n=1 Tax=Photobacterium nomapromontoriensis TaxID=2910237 RepID=UPI003D0E82F5
MISQRCKLPLKVATALSLVIVSALWLGWDRPYWAAFAVIVMAVTETTGHSLKKGRHRIIGTLCGVAMAFTLVGLFAQQPLPLLLSYTLFAAVCVYQQTNPRNGYAWSISLMVATLIIVMGKLSSDGTFNIAMLRIQETILGVLCFTVIFCLMWPASSRMVFFSTLNDYFQSQAQHLNTMNDTLRQQGCFDTHFSLGVSLKRLTRIEDLLQAAKVDSYQISSEYQHWRTLYKQLSEWALLCGHLSEAVSLFNTTFSTTQREAIELLLQNMQQRSECAATLLLPANATYHTDYKALYTNPVPIRLMINPLEINDSHPHNRENADSHQYGALHMLEHVLNEMDALHHLMLQTLFQAVTGWLPDHDSAQPALADSTVSVPDVALVRKPQKRPSAGLISIDPERAINAFKACLIIWVCIALWILVPMPGGPMIVMIGGLIGSAVLALPFANTRSMLLYMVGWACFFLIQYVTILPMLTEVWQLGAFYFLNTFGLWYVFNQPQHIFHRLLGSLNLVMMTNSAMALTPSYNIQSALLQLLIIGMGMLVIYFINHSVFSGMPERMLLRQLTQLRYSLSRGLKDRLSTSRISPLIVLPTPLRTVAMAEVASSQINWAAFPDIDPEKMAALINQAYSLCLYYRAFQDNYAQWQEHSNHPGIDGLIRNSVNNINSVLATKLHSEQLALQSVELIQLRHHLQDALREPSKNAILQFSLDLKQADICYRLLSSLEQLIEALNSVKRHSQQYQIHTLRLSPFTL